MVQRYFVDLINFIDFWSHCFTIAIHLWLKRARECALLELVVTVWIGTMVRVRKVLRRFVNALERKWRNNVDSMANLELSAFAVRHSNEG